MATPEVIDGKPVLVMDYSPATWSEVDNDPRIGPEGGQVSGWTLLHAIEALPENASLYFFDQISSIDKAMEEIIEKAEPGTYYRETPHSTFEFEQD